MELKDHLTTGVDVFTAFYLDHAKTSSNINESLSYVAEAKRRIEKEAKNETVLRDANPED